MEFLFCPSALELCLKVVYLQIKRKRYDFEIELVCCCPTAFLFLICF